MNLPPVTPLDIRGHLRVIHGIWVDDEKRTPGLRECHDTDHAQPWAHARVPHEHRRTAGSNTNNNNEGTTA